MALSASFAGKRILVTGGANGIGKAIIQRLVADNAVVSTIDRNQELLDKLKEELPAVRTEQCDVSKWKETRDVVNSLGPLDHLVNNAGIFTAVPFMGIQEDDFDQIFSINLKSVINVSQAVVSGMVSNKIQGSIVNVSSLSSQRAAGGLTLYGGTKAALNHLTKSMAFELGRAGIRVNSICPGMVDTDMTKLSPKETVDILVRRAAIRRLVQTDEVSDLVLFLLSSKASMITGQHIFIDGGLTTN